MFVRSTSSWRLRRRAAQCLVLAAAALVALSACSLLDAPPADISAPTVTPEVPTAVPVFAPTATPTIPDSGVGPIIVGVVMAETGVMAPLDGPALAAVRHQVDDLNARGGVLNREIDLRFFDTESTLDGAQDAAHDLIRAGVDLMIITCDPGFGRPALQAAAGVGVMAITPCGSDNSWLSDLNGELAFSLSTAVDVEGRVMAEWAFEEGIRNVAVIVDTTSPEAERSCDSFRKRWPELGGQIVFVDEMTYDSIEPFVDRLAQRPSNFDLVVLCSHLPGGLRGAPAIIEAIRAAGITVPLIGGSTMDDPTWLRGAVPTLGALTVVTPSSAYGNDPLASVNDLVAAINDGASVPIARGWSVYGADAVLAWERAVTKAGSVDGVAVSAAMETFSAEQLVSSAITFSPLQHMHPNRPLRILRFANEEVVVLDARAAESS